MGVRVRVPAYRADLVGDMSEDLRPSVSVGIKLASIAAHIEEFNQGEGATENLIAATSLVNDPEVQAYFDVLRPFALLPVKR